MRPQTLPKKQAKTKLKIRNPLIKPKFSLIVDKAMPNGTPNIKPYMEPAIMRTKRSVKSILFPDILLSSLSEFMDLVKTE